MTLRASIWDTGFIICVRIIQASYDVSTAPATRSCHTLDDSDDTLPHLSTCRRIPCRVAFSDSLERHLFASASTATCLSISYALSILDPKANPIWRIISEYELVQCSLPDTSHSFVWPRGSSFARLHLPSLNNRSGRSWDDRSVRCEWYRALSGLYALLNCMSLILCYSLSFLPCPHSRLKPV